MCPLGFAGFFRFSEIIVLRRCDIEIHSNFVNIFVEKSKTDIYRQGAWVIVASTGKDTCPVTMLIRCPVTMLIRCPVTMLIRCPVTMLIRCPVTMLITYLRKAELLDDNSSNQLIFCGMSYCKKKDLYKLNSKQLSYTRCREILLKAMEEIGENPKEFSLHSLRSGGASAAANHGVPDRLF